jgi:hypothetical protein
VGLLRENENIQTYGCDKCMYEIITDLNTWGFIGYSPKEIDREETEGI